MTRIGIISDTHSYWDERYRKYFSECDEIWHAGDIGSTEVAERLAAIKPLRAVCGNCDGGDLRFRFLEKLRFKCEDVDVLLTHIGGYPGKYDRNAYALLMRYRPDIFVCGHSHILKVVYDKNFNMMVLNPGAAGLQGFHIVRTALRFRIDGGKIHDMEVFKLDREQPFCG